MKSVVGRAASVPWGRTSLNRLCLKPLSLSLPNFRVVCFLVLWQDLEKAAEDACAFLRKGCSAAFACLAPRAGFKNRSSLGGSGCGSGSDGSGFVGRSGGGSGGGVAVYGDGPSGEESLVRGVCGRCLIWQSFDGVLYARAPPNTCAMTGVAGFVTPCTRMFPRLEISIDVLSACPVLVRSPPTCLPL